MSSLDDDPFGRGWTRTRQSRAQKRAERHAYVKDMAESDDSAFADVQSEEDPHSLDISAKQLRTLQSTDITLEAVRRWPTLFSRSWFLLKGWAAISPLDPTWT